MDCSGTFGSVVLSAPTIDTLNVHSVSADISQVWLTGTGSAVGDGSEAHYDCSVAGQCTITLGVNEADTCVVNAGAAAGTSCILIGATTGGPSGTSGPAITINAVTGSFGVLGNFTPASVYGASFGANGGKGGNAYVAGNAGDGGNGADGGLVNVLFAGNVSTVANNVSGVVAASVAGNGGRGGNAYVIGGSAGDGGLGGFGGDATASFTTGGILTSGDNSVGVGAFSRGGNGGQGGGGGGLFAFSAGGGDDAGRAGFAGVSIGIDGSIATFGAYSYGVQARSLGGGGGDSGGGFGLFYSGGSNGSTGGNGGTVVVTTNGVISTAGNYAHGILAQSIGGGGGDAGTQIGLVALGGNGGGGGSGGSVSVANTGLVSTSGFGANAIEAQSIGGGGGNGASSGGLVSLGGNGAGTSVGGEVSVTNSARLLTLNSEASGILAQSIGGGGGNGGTSFGLWSAGGNGGDGANGGTVSVTNAGDIITGVGTVGAYHSLGIVAQSIGGGGGNGGGSLAIDPLGFAAAFGGTGGAGGQGGGVFVNLDSASMLHATAYRIATYGDNSGAILAQSIGGGGGNGGFAVALATNGIFGVALGVAGDGGPGGAGGATIVNAKGTIETLGLNSSGILAQSIGGGGGNGGFALSAAGGLTAGVSVDIGGAGGSGGLASNVRVNTASDIHTLGANSSAIVAQSIGGGGGNGGFAAATTLSGAGAISVGIGGSGGSGGSASQVFVSADGTLITEGDGATGILAQSVGGGGGNGGFSFGAGIGVIGGGVAVGVGGSGGSGGIGGETRVGFAGSILTTGDNASAILGQSISGGGGNAGFSAQASIGGALGASVGIGGSGGDAQFSQSVTVTSLNDGSSFANLFGSNWSILTTGRNSNAVVAQSVGGGGGNGGVAATFGFSGVAAVGASVGGSAGAGGDASAALINNGELTSHSNIFTGGNNARGLLAQSIGGGGGNGGLAIGVSGNFNQATGVTAALSLGGQGASGGNASSAGITSFGNILTLGDMSDAIVAQAIGGGGGNGGVSLAGTVSSGQLAAAVSIGGAGAYGGLGGIATVANVGGLETHGRFSAGILAQSIGGGGGNGGFSGSGAISILGLSTAFSLGGTGGAGGDADFVSVSQTGEINTWGSGSSGIYAQSIGGGGGNGGSSLSASFGTVAALNGNVGGFGGTAGNASNVIVNSKNNIHTGLPVLNGGVCTDENGCSQSHGIVAQSIGGGGGNGGFSGSISLAVGGALNINVGGFGAGGGRASLVSVTSEGNIYTGYDHSNAILAQSIGGGGGDGGFSASLSGAGALAGAISVGGFALSGGGDGDIVAVDSRGNLLTLGNSSSAIIAQSIGGGGGHGGFSAAGALATSIDNVGFAGSVSVGGAGSTGGNGGAVSVLSAYKSFAGVLPDAVADPALWTLQTAGSRSHGILAQSIGGGGGDGGVSLAGALGPGALTASIGGFGVGGGNGSLVTVTSVNNIRTSGRNSSAIAAQSIGGGGGDGGVSVSAAAGTAFAGSLSLGGVALSGGGDGSQVTVSSYGVLATLGRDSSAIIAQSIGGGGGNGGVSVAGDFAIGVSGTGVAGALSVGGFGSAGGSGGQVHVLSSHALFNGLLPPPAPALNVVTLSTLGDRSNGILAQSIGGGGGNGGYSFDVAVAPTALGATIGGFGLGGGNGGAVSVRSINNIETRGNRSNGVLAQSIGGGGGNGGGSQSRVAANEFAGNLTVGGFGLSGGGNGGHVTIDSTGLISTWGDHSNGLAAQSIGGGGGNGGTSISGTLVGGNFVTLAATVGGTGSNGGTGGAVNVRSNQGAIAGTATTIFTRGDSATGILAQSIGGGGGDGGMSFSGVATFKSNFAANVGIGGFGGDGNKAGIVTVESVDNIFTQGLRSNAIAAQSIGGGGGNGGLSLSGTIAVPIDSKFTGTLAMGGFGGSGAHGGAVSITSDGLLTTAADDAAAILAQSIGGGGGNGGISIAGTLSVGNPNQVPSVSVSVGGTAGAGGAGGTVDVTHAKNIVTRGNNAEGIVAQSIGGGGGNGGLAISGVLSGVQSTSIAVSVGGFGGDGSNASGVSVTNTGNITTGTFTILEQQIAQPGFEVIDGAILRTGNYASGILAQSIGGGGGKGGLALSGSIAPIADGIATEIGVSVGGLGGDGGYAGIVKVNNSGDIQTFGNDAYGVHAQSIGGGGGIGGTAVSGVLAFGDGVEGASIATLFSIGGKGGSGNAAGAVTVDQSGSIQTSGASSIGILAQSIGGGGGTGGGANSLNYQIGTKCSFTLLGLVTKVIESCTSTTQTNINVNLDIGGRGGQANDAGAVFVTNHGSLTTTGDWATGILAQSVGGGGGFGGNGNVGYSGLFTGSGIVDLVNTLVVLPVGAVKTQYGLTKFTVGGSGGAGGDGNSVRVTNDGQIHTSGADSHGIFAQSIGGGGGSGGNAGSGLLGVLSIGGRGAASGNGGSVNVTSLAGGDITTSGKSAKGIFAQSIGGGGGNGGNAGGLIAIGGTAAASGNGGTVTAANFAKVLTSGEHSTGIHAQSVGGGGGSGSALCLVKNSNGKCPNTIPEPAGNGGSILLSVGAAFGGAGSSSGNGGNVTLLNHTGAEIDTFGDFSHGAFAQSIGGGGGSAAADDVENPLGSGGGSGGSAAYGSIFVSGRGGTAGNGGDVRLLNDGTVATAGQSSHALFGQSVGGGGGTAGGALLALTFIGGNGGSAGDGGDVSILNSGFAGTYGKGSDALRAQSVGGGGGSGNGTFGIGSLDIPVSNIGFGFSLGGDGSSGGNGGHVDVQNKGQVYTEKEFSNGIFAQSIGGGGGSGGQAIGNIAIGGRGGASGDGGNVDVTNDLGAAIVTRGIMSHGIFAESVGGGGGDSGKTIGLAVVTGGAAVSVGRNGPGGGNGGAINVTNRGFIETDGIAASAIFAQSVGGGGGDGSLSVTAAIPTLLTPAVTNVSVAVGGKGGGGGNGGNVNITNEIGASILSQGDASAAIFAQSVGGGGGKGGFSGGFSTFPYLTVSVALGGSGGSGGDGGNVFVKNCGTIQVDGKDSVAILAQSVGGGGGDAGWSFSGVAVPIAIGGQDGATGHGGDVTVENNCGQILMSGENSLGVIAQSVGGGGGRITIAQEDLEKLTTPTALQVGGKGNGGNVHVFQRVPVIMTGDNSVAMFAQSVGGGGGLTGSIVDAANGAGGGSFAGTAGGTGIAQDIDVSTDSDLVSTGENSIALLAQSEGADGNGNITLTLNSGSGGPSLFVGGSGTGSAVSLLGGADNTITNFGIVTTVLDIDGTSVRGTSGNDAFLNHYITVGSVNLGSGNNSFDNKAGAEFHSGAIVDLTTQPGGGNAANALLTNAGRLLPGSFGRAFTTGVDGYFQQLASGIYDVDLDLSKVGLPGESDLLHIAGGATLAGLVDVNVMNVSNIQSGVHDVLILRTTGANVTNLGLALDAPQSAVATFGLTYPNPKDVVLNYSVNFAPDGLNRNQTNLGEFINRMQENGGSGQTAPLIAALFTLPYVDDLAKAYDELLPEIYTDNEINTFVSSTMFANALLSCRTKAGAAKFIAEGDCVWGRVSVRSINGDGTREYIGYDEDVSGFSGGLQKAIDGDTWHLGLALAYETSDMRASNGDLSQGQRYQFGVSLKNVDGPWVHSASLTGGRGEFDISRVVSIAEFTGVAGSEQDLGIFALHLRSSRAFVAGDFYLKPSLDLGLTRLELDAVREWGTPSIAFDFPGQSEIFLTLNPMIEVGGDIDVDDDLMVQPFARAGILEVLTGSDPAVTAGFAHAPPGLRGFDTFGRIGKTMGDFGIGADVFIGDRVDLRVDGAMQFTGDKQVYQGGLKAAIRF